MKKFLTSKEIQETCKTFSDLLSLELSYSEKEIVFICTLKGAFPFFNSVVNQLHENVKEKVQLEFIQASSYKNNHREEVTLNNFLFDIQGKEVVIFEDILDSYCTIESILFQISPVFTDTKITIATLLAKPTTKILSYKTTGGQLQHPKLLVGKMLPPDTGFLYGFGLDNNQKGRLLPDIYLM